jgi:hypothetical protein
MFGSNPNGGLGQNSRLTVLQIFYGDAVYGFCQNELALVDMLVPKGAGMQNRFA